MGKRKKINATRGGIFNRWKNICIDNRGRLHYEGDYPIEESVPVVIDWEEQHCWACGKRIISHNKKYLEWVRTESYFSIWNDSEVDGRLQRAHIVPDSLGGSPTADNLFLLCPKCHESSPDTNNRQMFFQWIYNKRKNICFQTKDYYFKTAVIILRDQYGITYPMFDTWNEIIRVGNNIGMHQSSVMVSSYISLIVANGLKNKSGLEDKAEKMFEDTIRGKIAELIRENPNDEKIKIYKEVLGWYREAKEFETTQELKID